MRLLFQPAEEGGAGGDLLVKEGEVMLLLPGRVDQGRLEKNRVGPADEGWCARPEGRFGRPTPPRQWSLLVVDSNE